MKKLETTMKRTEPKEQFNVRINRVTFVQLQALAKLRGVSQARLVEELAQPAIKSLADAWEVQR